jgi:hypothetical protein
MMSRQQQRLFYIVIILLFLHLTAIRDLKRVSKIGSPPFSSRRISHYTDEQVSKRVKFGLQRVPGTRNFDRVGFELFALESNLVLSSETIQAGGFASGLISGAATRIAKELFLHPLDTIRARQQTNPLINSSLNENILSIWSVPVSRLYDGILPALLSGVPSGAIFFAVKDSTSSVLRAFGISGYSSTIVAVLAANIPYWLIRAPAEVRYTFSFLIKLFFSFFFLLFFF